MVNWIYIEEKAGKYPKARRLGEERHEAELKIGHILKKDKENIQKKGCKEKKDVNRSENWIYIEERQEKYPKEKVLGEESHEMERKVGYKMRKSRENIQNAA